MNLNANGLGSGGGFLPGASSTGTPTEPKEQDQQSEQLTNLASHQTALGAGLGTGGPPQAMPQQAAQQAAQQYATQPHQEPTNQAQGMAQSNDPNIAAQGQAMLAGQQGAAPPSQQQGGIGGMLSFHQRFAQAPWGGQQPHQQGAAAYGQPSQQGLAAGGGYGGQSPFQHQFAQAGWGGQQYQPAAPAQQQGQFGFGQMAQAAQQLGSGQPQNPNQINQQRAALGSAMNR